MLVTNLPRPPSGCNDNNLHQYIPILPTNPITVDTNWANGLPDWIKISLSKRFPDAIYQQISVPHIDIDRNESFWNFYRWYYDLYDMFIYKDLMDRALFIPLSNSQKDELKNLCNVGILRHSEPNLESCAFLESTFSIIREYIKLHRNTGVFVKLSHKSAKNNHKLYSSFTLTDVFDNLVHSEEVLNNVDKSTSIVLKPWNDDISKATEYRVFIEQKKVVGISQQAWHTPQHEPPQLDGILDALKKLQIPYNDAILDVNYKDGILHLIEINPGCIWHSSGSSLFRWEELKLRFHEDEVEVEVRVYRR